MRNPLRRFRNPGLLLAGALVYGTLGYMAIEGWGPLDAFFMTLITITTVGYDEVHQLDAPGRLFTTSLILGGVETVSGGIIGAIVYKALNIWLVSQTDLSKLVLGAFIVLIVIAFPRGIVGTLEMIRRRRGGGTTTLVTSRIETAE